MRRLLALLAAPVLTIGLAACGDDGDSTPGDEPTSTSTSSPMDTYNDTDNDGEAPAGESSPGGGGDGGKANPDAESTDY